MTVYLVTTQIVLSIGADSRDDARTIVERILDEDNLGAIEYMVSASEIINIDADEAGA